MILSALLWEIEWGLRSALESGLQWAEQASAPLSVLRSALESVLHWAEQASAL